MTKKSPTYIAYGLLAVTCLAGWLLGADIVAQLASQPSPVPTTAPSDTRQWLAVNAAGTFHARETVPSSSVAENYSCSADAE